MSLSLNRRSRRSRRIPLLVLCLVASGVASAGPATSEAKPTSPATVPGTVPVTVGAMSGRLWVQRVGTRAQASLSVRRPLYIGDIIGTGARSKATILFPDGAQARLNANSSIQITGTKLGRGGRQSLFRAISGQVWARLRPGNAIETRTAALGVLGTEIQLDVGRDGTTTLTVTDGRVEFYNAFGSVVVEQQQQSTARQGAAPTKPITIQNAGLIVEWSFDLNRAMIPREKFFQTPDRQAAAALLPRLSQALSRAVSQAALQTSAPGQEKTPTQVLEAQVLARREYGDALFDSGRYDEARAQYTASALLAPGQAALKVRLGYALLEMGRLEEAEAAIKAALFASRSAASTQFVSAETTSGQEEEAGADAEGSATSEPSGELAALVALADLKLERDEPQAAAALARRAISNGDAIQARHTNASLGSRPGSSLGSSLGASLLDMRSCSARAHLALGISLLREGGRIDEAVEELRAVLGSEPQVLEYQARAWLSLALLSQNDTAAALEQAKQAVRLAPGSGLARGNLALVAFYAGDARLSRREAERALELNPESVAARVALGQALLAQGAVDEARAVAAQAVALDDDLPQARYLLGITDASRRDYKHAVRELSQAIALAPADLLARSALARTYNAIGQGGRAILVLREALPQQRRSGDVLAALGDVLYDQGRYTESAAHYQDALGQNSGSALYQAGLARTLIVSNRIEEGIKAARAAVALAPGIGQYHAILGQALQYGQMPAQAEREFNDALLLDPRNALALAQLALRHSSSDLRPAAAGFAQGFLLDPSIARQLLRGGVHTELSPSVGNDGLQGLELSHRSEGASGKLNTFGIFSRSDGGGFRPNDGRKLLDASEHLTFLPDSKTTLYLSGRVQRDAGGLAGPLSQPDGDDRSRFSYGQVQVAARRRLSQSSHLWLGLFGNASRNGVQNPDLNSFFDSLTSLPVSSQRLNSRALVPEVRYDLDLGSLGRSGTRSSRLSLGAALSRTRFRSARDLALSPNETGSGLSEESDRGLMLYSQITQQVSSRLSLSAQMRLQRLRRDSASLLTLPGGLSFEGSGSRARSYVLPSLLAAYQLSPSTSLRLLHSDRLTDVSASTLAPSEMLLTTERGALPFGIAERTRLSQIELQRRTSSRSYIKAFAFRTQASNVQIGYNDLLGFGGGLPSPSAPGLRIERWRGEGLGARYEQQVSRHLFLSTGATLRRTLSQSNGLQTVYSGADAPYEPKYLGHINLNYIDGKGNKAGIQVRRTGSFYQDTPLALGRPLFGAATYVDLLLAREPSVGVEFYVGVSNLFNRKQILFNDFPSGQRRLNFGVTRRF